MLPSGNDAAHVIAESLGKVLYKKTETYKRKKANNPKLTYNVKEGYQCFLNTMNKTARELNLTNTSFANPHGLSNRNNKSTSNDLSRLCYIAMKKYSLFREVIHIIIHINL